MNQKLLVVKLGSLFKQSDLKQPLFIHIIFHVLQESGRRAFWSVNGPRILQVGYEDEEHPKVMEAYEQIGALVLHIAFSFLSICFNL